MPLSLSCATATVHAQLTLNPPATSTKTAKLVRCALEHCTAVRFPMTLISSVATPAVAQLPLPILYIIMHTWNTWIPCTHHRCVTYGSEKFQKVHRYDELLSILGNVKFILIKFSIFGNRFEAYKIFPVVLNNPICAERISEAERVCVDCP